MEVSSQLHASAALHPPGNNPWYPLDRGLGGPQNQSGRGDEKKNSQPLPGLEPPIIVTNFITTVKTYVQAKEQKHTHPTPLLHRAQSKPDPSVTNHRDTRCTKKTEYRSSLFCGYGCAQKSVSFGGRTTSVRESHVTRIRPTDCCMYPLAKKTT
jgi:hypothetical protein